MNARTEKARRYPARRGRQRRRSKRRRRLFFLLFAMMAAAGIAAALTVPIRARYACPPGVDAADTGRQLSDAEKLAVIRTDAAYPAELVEFAQRHPQAIDYVYHFPQRRDTVGDIDLTAEACGDTVPLLMQWDARWGYAPYSGGHVGYTGCGPVCLSMAALYLTGNTAWTPATVAAFAEANGYAVPGSGSSWTLIGEGSRALGLAARELPLDQGVMRDALDGGQLIILVVGPGDFTSSGHFILVRGCDENGFWINDPNSRENSEKSWNYDTLRGQIRNLWALSAL